MGKIIDLTGQRFGMLQVIERSYTHKSKEGKPTWKCLCDCQMTKPEKEREYCYVTTGDLRKKVKVKSCGCYKHEMLIKRNKTYMKKLNKYDLDSYDYGVGYTSKGEKFFFDKEDYDLIKNDNWIVVRGYVLRSRDNMPMHRLIMKVENVPYNNIRIDHIGGRYTTNDNRKSNLRIVNPSENTMNSTIRSNNKSGVTGVYWSKSHNKWCSSITVNYKKIHLGYFENFNDAVDARKKAENKYFGEFSYDNSQIIFKKVS